MSTSESSVAAEELPTEDSIPWTRAGTDSSNLRTHTFDLGDDGVLRLRPSKQSKRMAKILAVVGFVVLGGGVTILATVSNKDVRPFGYFMVILWVMPVLCALLLHLTYNRVFEFDLASDRILIPPRPIDKYMGGPSETRVLPLDDVHALQLLSMFHEDDSASDAPSSHYSFELNLVLVDGERVTLTNQGNGNEARHDANHLAEALRVPLWIEPDMRGV